MAWTTPKTWTTGELVTAADMNVHIRDNLNALNQELLLPQQIAISAWERPYTHVNFSTVGTNASALNNCSRYSSGAQNDSISWLVVLEQGTWNLELVHLVGTTTGIYSIRLNDTEIATLDGYNATTVNNVRSTVTGITINATDIYTLSFKMTTKNASSTNYYGNIVGITLWRDQ